jgi:hypothetical protein
MAVCIFATSVYLKVEQGRRGFMGDDRNEPQNRGQGGDHGHGPKEKQYEFTVDGIEYATPSSALSGAQIKALIPNFDPSYQLVKEGKGNEADEVVTDETTVSLDVHPSASFYTVPPATFGR